MKLLGRAEEIAKEINRVAVQTRGNLEYRENAYGITELLYCPLKAKFRRLYPEISATASEESPAIARGFLFENAVKQALKNIFGEENVLSDTEITLQYDLKIDEKEFLIDGHPDIIVRIDDRTLALIEVKSVNMLFDNQRMKPENLIITTPEESRITISESYILQAKVQKYLAKKIFDKEIESYLFIQAMVKGTRRTNASYVVVPINLEMTDEEFESLVREFLNNPTPRYTWECNYCPYRKEGICEGSKEFKQIKGSKISVEELYQLLKRREELKTELQTLEDSIKKVIGTIEIDGKEYGWYKKTTYKWDYPALSRVLKKYGRSITDFIQINWRKEPELVAFLEEKGEIENAVKEIKKEDRPSVFL